jgi:hypothetical protein
MHMHIQPFSALELQFPCHARKVSKRYLRSLLLLLVKETQSIASLHGGRGKIHRCKALCLYGLYGVVQPLRPLCMSFCRNLIPALLCSCLKPFVMARQTGILLLSGTIGDITYVHTRHGFYARKKRSIPPGSMQHNPRYARTWANARDFGRAARCARLLRLSLAAVIRQSSDYTTTRRLTGQMAKAVQADCQHPPGQRQPCGPQAALLQGFEFNADAPLSRVLKAPYATTIRKTTGQAELLIPDLNPSRQLKAPEGATHFRLLMAAAVVDFEAMSLQCAEVSTEVLSMRQSHGGVSLGCSLPAGSALPAFMVLGIVFYQGINGCMEPLSPTGNALQIVAVDTSIPIEAQDVMRVQSAGIPFRPGLCILPRRVNCHKPLKACFPGVPGKRKRLSAWSLAVSWQLHIRKPPPDVSLPAVREAGFFPALW